MMIEGQKMACLACIRGHRVSGCTHTERELLPIAKKGRPVSQCQHCRQLRKSRSTHVKCECASLAAAKKAREEQQRQLGLIHPSSSSSNDKNCCSTSTTTTNGAVVGLTATAPGSQHAGVAVSPPSAAAAATTGVSSDSKSGGHSSPSSNDTCQCCFGPGNRCICALKTENSSTVDLISAMGSHHPLDAISEFCPPASKSPPAMLPHQSASEPPIRVPKAKPRLTSTHSETSLTTFHNGHHKPTHKHHSSIHGASPYSIPTVGHTGHTFGEHEGCHKVQHSHWDLHNTNNNGTASAPPSVQLTHRRIKSEHSSPDLRTYAGIPMNTANGPNLITPLELTPRPQPPVQPVRPAINRTSSGRIQTGLSVVTNHDFGMQNFMAPPSAGPDNSHSMTQFSADLFPNSATGWPMSNWETLTSIAPHQPYITPTAPPSSVGGFEDSQQSAYPISNMSDTNDYLERLRMFPPPLTNSTSGDDVSYDDWHNPSPPPYSSGIAISNADSDHFADDQSWVHAGYSAQSSMLNLPSLDEGPIGYDAQTQQQQSQPQVHRHQRSEKLPQREQPVDLWVSQQPPTPSVEDPFQGGVLINAADVVTTAVGGELFEPGYLVMPHDGNGMMGDLGMGGLEGFKGLVGQGVKEVVDVFDVGGRMLGSGGVEEQQQRQQGVAQRVAGRGNGAGNAGQMMDEFWINGPGVSEMWLN